MSKAQTLPRFETLQPWYNLYDRVAFEGALAELCRREKLGVIPYFGLASGFLTGKYRTEKDIEGSARGSSAKETQRARPSHSRGARRGGVGLRRDAGADRARVAEVARRGADRERDEREQLEELAGFADSSSAATRSQLDEASEGGSPPPAW